MGKINLASMKATKAEKEEKSNSPSLDVEKDMVENTTDQETNDLTSPTKKAISLGKKKKEVTLNISKQRIEKEAPVKDTPIDENKTETESETNKDNNSEDKAAPAIGITKKTVTEEVDEYEISKDGNEQEDEKGKDNVTQGGVNQDTLNTPKEKKEEPIKLGDQVLAKDPESIFSNYTSDFEKEESNILSKIKKLKDIPRTRPVLVGGLLGITAIIITALFVINPEKHSLNNYKATLIGYFSQKDEVVGVNNSPGNQTQETEIENNSENANNIENKVNEELIENENNKIQWQIESIIRSGYKITLESRTTVSGVKVYRYKNTEFDSKEKLDIELDKDIDGLKNKKVQNFLLPKKKKSTNNTETVEKTSNTSTAPSDSNLEKKDTSSKNNLLLQQMTKNKE